MRLKTIIAATACSALVFPAFGQDENAAQDEASTKRLTPVTVTAQKRAQSIQDVPISISAYDAAFLEDSGVANLTDVALYSPNFTITSSSQKTNSRITIRGVGSVGNAGIEPSVGVFIDGVYYPRPGSVIGNLIDLEAVEVLRGPQGTLFGRNTPMGALNVRTKDPSRDSLEAYGEFGLGSFDSIEAGGSLSGPLSDGVSMRVSAKYTERGGFGDNLLTGDEVGAQDEFHVRGKLLFDMNEQFDLKITADYGEIESGGATVELLNGTESAAFLATLQALGGAEASQLLTADAFDHDIYQDHRDSLNDEQWGLAADASFEFATGHTLRSITSYREWEAKNFESAIRLPIQLLPRLSDYKTETISQEFQLVSPTDDTFEYVIGAFLYDESYTISQDFNLGSDFCIPVVAGLAGAAAGQGCAAGQQIRASDGEFSQDLQSTAFFGQATWYANDKLSLTLGGRWTSDEKDAEFTNTVNNPFVTALRVRDDENQPGLTVDDSKFTYFANASYFPVEGTMFFATISTGYKSGGFNTDGTFPALTTEQRTFSEEDTTNYEIGVKSTLFDNTLQVNATLFSMDIEGFQDRAFDGISFVTRNVGELRQQGFETDFVWAPLDQLSFIGGLSYLDSEFQDYRNASPLPGGPVQDLTGERAHLSPDWQGSLVANWEDRFPAISGARYFLRGETQYVGEANVGANTNQNPQSVQDAYQLLNARIGLRAEDDRWEVNLWGKNLSDEGYCTTIFDQPFGAQLGGLDAVANTIPQRCVVGTPQTYGVQLKVRR